MLELTDVEQSVVDEAAAKLAEAQARAQQAEQAFAEARGALQAAGAHLTGAVRAVLLLRKLNPDAYVASWHADSQKVAIQAKPAEELAHAG